MSAQAKPLLFLLATSVLVLLPCTVVASNDEYPPYKPLVSPVTKDPNTSLYTISIKNDAPLVIDLAGPIIWSTCPPAHPTIPCNSSMCTVDNRRHPQSCSCVDGGRDSAKNCTCTACPCNPITGKCGAGDLTSFTMSANATDGRNPLYPVAFSTVGSCAPDRLLASLPAGSTGVAGLSRWPLSLPSQLAAQRKFGNKFVLCLPGVAIFGNSSVYLGTHPPDLANTIPYTPLVKNQKNAAYYLPVRSISVDWDQAVPVLLPRGSLDLDFSTGHGGVVLSTVTPYTTMRPDVYRPFIQAYDTAMKERSYVVRVPAVKQFHLCYSQSSLRMLKRTGFDVPVITMELAGATRNWTIYNGNILVPVGGGVVCVGFVKMGLAGGGAVEDAPAMVIGGFQLEDNLLAFDMEKGVLGFSMLLWGRETTCRSFNFTASN